MFNFLVQKLHREGYRFLAIAAVATFILLLISKILGLPYGSTIFLGIPKDFQLMMKIT